MKATPRPNGAKIEDLRWERRMTASDLANRTGISRQYLNRIIRGTRGASLAVQESLAEVLNVPIEEIQESES